MIFREAVINDIEQMHEVRMAVKENVLSNPGLVTMADYVKFLSTDGKGWVCESNGVILGFSIVDIRDHNIWALFIKPGSEKQGIGRRLHGLMLDWYFQNYTEDLWLGTEPGTRAEIFYARAGWSKTGTRSNGETRFGITRDTWNQLK